MGSLIRRAQQYLDTLGPEDPRRRLTVIRREDAVVRNEDDISPEERRKIDAQIEQAVSSSRMAVTPEALRITAKRKGGVLPVLVNVGAVVVVAAGILAALYLFRRSEESIISAPIALETAEGKLLEAVKQESRQQIEGKDREIASIRQKLAGVDEEKERIRTEAADRVRAREKELEEELARTLDAERRKLQAQGLPEETVTRRIAEIEERTRAEDTERLEQYRREAEAERAEREKTVELLRTEYERTLAQAQGDRARLQEETTRRQAELEAGFQQKQLSLERDTATAMAELETLRRQQQNEQLVLDQFLTYYRRASEAIRGAQLGDARAVLTEFRRYLDEPSVASLQAVSRRRPVELFLIDSLEEAIASRESEAATTADIQSLAASADLIAAVAALVEQGDALYGERDYARARELYLSALARIPAVQAGLTRLDEIEEVFRSKEQDQVAALLGAANAAYRTGDYPGAVRGYGSALELLQGDRGAVDTLIAQLTEIGARTRDAERAAAEAQLAQLREELAVSRASGTTADLTELRRSLEDRETTIRTLREDAATVQRAAEAKQAAAEAQVAQLREQLAALEARGATPDARRDAVLALRERLGTDADAGGPSSSRAALLALLETKLLVQRILLSDEVLAEYPDLYDGLDRYLEALVAEKQSEARLETLRDLDGVLAGLLAGAGSEETIPKYGSADQTDLLLGILDKLAALLE